MNYLADMYFWIVMQESAVKAFSKTPEKDTVSRNTVIGGFANSFSNIL